MWMLLHPHFQGFSADLRSEKPQVGVRAQFQSSHEEARCECMHEHLLRGASCEDWNYAFKVIPQFCIAHFTAHIL